MPGAVRNWNPLRLFEIARVLVRLDYGITSFDPLR
jgi:hypothetical protein